MSQMAELALFAPGPPTRVLCRKDVTEGVHLGAALGFPRAESHPSDETAPTQGPGDALAVTALRALFTAGGPLIAETSGASVDIVSLRAAFARDVGEGAARFSELGLRWRDDSVERFFVQPGRGDVLKHDVIAFCVDAQDTSATAAVDVGNPAASDELTWHSVDELRRDWSKGRTLLSPSLAGFMQSNLAATGRGAAGPLKGAAWWVAPHLQMLPIRTPTLPPATHTNTFLIGGDELVLVEPASPYEEELDVIEEWVRSATARGATLRAVLATHHHPDHIGGAIAVRDRLGAPLWAHAMTASRLEGVVAFDRELADGEVIDLGDTSLTAVHTPGHAPGHLCFVDATSGAMIAGDMVAGVGTILVEPHDGDMGLYLDSLRRMARMEPSMLLPAHGGVIRDSQQWLEFYEQHRLMREQKVLDALSAFGAPALPNDLVATAYDDAPKAVWPLALRSIEAHLIKLVKDGRATQSDDRWVLV